MVYNRSFFLSVRKMYLKSNFHGYKNIVNTLKIIYNYYNMDGPDMEGTGSVRGVIQ